MQGPVGKCTVVKKPQGLLRLGLVWDVLDQLGPDTLPVVREQFLSCHEATSSGLDGCAMGNRDRAGSVCPSADVGRMCANSFRQRRLAAAFLREVGFDVHRAPV